MYSIQGWLSKIVDKLINERIYWVKKNSRYNLFVAISDIALLIIRNGIAYFTAFRAVFNNEITISQFVFFFGAITGFSVFLSGFTKYLSIISLNNKEVMELRNYLEKDDFIEKGRTFSFSPGESICIELKNISFRFKKDGPYILKNINMKINKGEKIALVGENGAGKTTLVKLLCGFYQPTEGTILYNGVDSSELSREFVENLFAASFQDIYVLPMSIAENIAFSEARTNPEGVKDCLKIAGLGDLFTDIHTPVTKMLHKDGVILSGGQQQKLILARAAYKIIYKNAPILVLDEPTAALDAIAERQFYEKYNELSAQKTTIFISHRLASTQFCDRIILLSSGEIIESGSHRELVENSVNYKELYEIQSRYYQ